VETIRTVEAMRRRSRAARGEGLLVGLVPTMGYLHEGHLSLVRRARSECGFTVTSIFVNPTQFGPGEDLERYPRDLDRDAALLEEAGIDVIFCPDDAEMYPGGLSRHRTWVEVEGLSGVLCGAARTGHFRGVATVVTKLLNIVEPDAAYFGQKDAQQAILIRRMAGDLDMASRIVVCPTVREADGLAMSSRNAYLSEDERRAAPVIHRALERARREAGNPGVRPGELVDAVREVLAGEPSFAPEYVELVAVPDLDRLEGDRPLRERGLREALLAVAGRLGETRLIDNLMIELER